MKRKPSINEFVDNLVKYNESGKPFALFPHEREYLRLVHDLISLCNCFIYSTIKKTGKTTLQAIFQSGRSLGLEYGSETSGTTSQCAH